MSEEAEASCARTYSTEPLYRLRLASDAYGIEHVEGLLSREAMHAKVDDLLDNAECMMASDTALSFLLCVDVGNYFE